ncbi:UNVERIFIED_CONTAM: hypothetical protein Scaly_0489800 [Sesamum calycinum]|uniref:BED-type domain-containing protein n=1 Tax=Sesamum calycinum TaxID=2727403 RepID=A0AAW2RP48_9LAMI
MASNMEPVAVTSQKHDPAWKHCQMFKNGDRVQLKCIYCGKIFKGGGIHRIKEHLAGQKGNAATCLRVQPDVRLQMLESLNGVAVKKRKKTETCRGDVRKVSNTVHMAVGRFFFDVGLPVDAVNSAYFQPMIDAIASQGTGVVGPSYHDLRSWILKNLVHEVRNDVDQCTGAWGRTGCSILVDEWNSGKGKTFVNFLVYCPEGTIFLRSADISHAIDSADVLYELLKETVEEVGLRNVLQVITSCDDRYVIAGKRLTDTYPTVFWTPCAGRSIDLMLHDIERTSNCEYDT